MLMRSLRLHSTHKTILLHLKLTLLFFLFVSFSSHGNLVRAHVFIYAGCSQEKYQPSSPFEGNLNSLLASVCRGDLKTIDCSRCIQSTVNQIGLVCPYSYGAALQLEGCYLRYEHNDFLGQLDTSLRYKKCSKSVNNDVEFFRRRDDVLADLQTGIGFKVSSSGLVEGYAQCLGDLNSADCSSCLANVVGMLKNLCGSASAADVFLGQCYARYWASGYYDISVDSSNEDQVGKTVAIIVGVVAGLAVLIVLLSFCRKSMG
ncbi:plasmodesmata-located protein 8 isoform X3 [Ricinus communis]|uniref:plasmodesmata-located protein 8 isoform X3 n=1 Tax=Ricinus communis TaxID=3988 RepID=UPI000D687BF5|nr:plasmodesmata-located protein 8 isoform X3 [Ricinus communis]|eukprot:XP_025015807.1 cysteine-rich repeat secretory protein 15 isoform X3 [Ricinus communis]